MIKYLGVELDKTFKMNNLQYLVVGTGRCGTVYLAKLLTSLGIPCGHEAVFTTEGFNKTERILKYQENIEVSLISKLAHQKEEANNISWLKDFKELVADSSYMAAPYLNLLENTKIIHIVRDPLKVINSFVYGFDYFQDSNVENKYFKPYYEFIYKHLPELIDLKTPLDRCAYFYVKWNEMIEKYSSFFFRIEDKVDDLLLFLGKENFKNYYNNTQSNHKIGVTEQLTSYQQIPNEEIRNLLIGKALKYKYIRKQLL